MATGHAKLMRQVGERGFFADVTVEAEIVSTTNQLTVSFDERFAREYRLAATFGADYAWEQYSNDRRRHRGLSVRVLEIQWQPVDTTGVLVAFATAQAVWQALGWNPTGGPRFEELSGGVFFPKSVAV